MKSSIKKCDEAFYEQLSNVDFDHYFWPINFEEEKEKFFRSLSVRQKYNPFFHYPALTEQDYLIIDFLKNSKIPEGDLGKLFSHVRSRYLTTFEMVENRSAEHFTELAQKKYGIPSTEIIQDAQGILKKYRNHPIQDAYMGIQAVIEKIKDKLAEYHIKDWLIEEGPSFIWMVHTNTISKKIILPEGLLINQRWVDKIIQQSIEVVIFQDLNAQNQPLRILELGLDRFEETRRALILELSHRTGLVESQSLRRVAGGVLASYLGNQYSFWETFERLSNLFSENQAFSLTANVKMGLQDTAERGGLLNTHLTLQGWKKLQTFTLQQLHHLYVGHVGMDQLPWIENALEEKKLTSPNYLPLVLGRISR